MVTLRRGDKGNEVKLLQERLRVFEGTPLVVDGDFGAKTEDAVERFQEQKGLLVDGIVGRVTWKALGVVDEPAEWDVARTIEWNGWKKTPCDMTVPGDPNQGYDSTTLRADVADAFAAMRMEAMSFGAKITSAGGRRRPSHTANSNQSQKSFHTVGRAHDLALPSGMSDPHTDLYIVEPDPENPRYWVVWARAMHGETRELDGWVHSLQKTVKTTAKVINLTALMAKHGFERIRARKSYKKSNYGSAEWWHHQYERGLIVGESTYGEELLKVWRLDELEGTGAWEHRDAVFGVSWF